MVAVLLVTLWAIYEEYQARKPRRVIDFLKMTDNVAPRPAPA